MNDGNMTQGWIVDEEVTQLVAYTIILGLWACMS
jgi:hypothetical protein